MLRQLLARRPAPRALPPAVDGWEPPPLLPEPGAGDALLEELLALAPGRRVLLAWGDGGRVARMSIALRAAGAASTLAAHPGEVPAGATGELLEAGRRMGLSEVARELAFRAPVPMPDAAVAAAVDCDAGRPWRVGGAPGDLALAVLAGRVDVVADGSQLIHWPDPLARLRALAATGARHVVIETPLVRADAALTAAGFAPGSVWYAVGMSPEESVAMAAHWRRREVRLHQYELMPQGFGAAEAWHAGIEATAWWSFFDRAGLARLLALAGLRAVRLTPVWDGRAAVVVAEPDGT
jgi:hypothetical protein